MRGHPPGPRGDIEDPRADTDGRSRQQRLDHPNGDTAEEPLIGDRLLLPARCLEGVERIAIDRRVPHDSNPTTERRVRRSLPADSRDKCRSQGHRLATAEQPDIGKIAGCDEAPYRAPTSPWYRRSRRP